jgi:lysyl-tRNA synthetase class 1
MKPKTTHWADIAAARIVATRGDKEQYVVASGITPSGVVHIGNIREVITVDLVARALRDLGRPVRFIYSWDDFDTFRKVPANLPQAEMMKGYLRQPISRIPDPFGTARSYAAHNIETFQRALEPVGIKPEYLYQEQRYGQALYAAQIRQALEHTPTIRAILDEFRSEPLAADWLPTAIYCERCNRDEMEFERYDGEWAYSYECKSCGHGATTDIRTTRNLKLNWRTDWPMRWAYEKVDFEPGGKDHSSDGGSFDTGKKISKAVWGWEPPIYLQYDFVSIKGGPGKMSSSSGNAVALGEVLEVYSPAMVRWIFARQKPNTDFALAFDEDVIKLHDEFDRMEEQAYAPGAATDQKWLLNRRTYELSLPDPWTADQAKSKPYRPAFRVLCNRLQICGGDIERTLARYYAGDVKTAADRESFACRARRAWTWLGSYAPEEFRYSLHAAPVDVPMTPEMRAALASLRGLIEACDLDAVAAPDLNQAIYDRVVHGAGVEPKSFFQAVYRRLIGRDQGPRLPSFLKEIGKEKLLELL